MNQVFVDFEPLGRRRVELVDGESAVSLLRRLVERVADAGTYPGGRRLLDAQLHRDRAGEPGSSVRVRPRPCPLPASARRRYPWISTRRRRAWARSSRSPTAWRALEDDLEFWTEHTRDDGAPWTSGPLTIRGGENVQIYSTGYLREIDIGNYTKRIMGERLPDGVVLGEPAGGSWTVVP